MKVIFKIAWRNIWRNRMRSLVVITSIALGIWAGVFVGGFSFGLNSQRIAATINNSISHLQLHHPDWQDENQFNLWVDQPQRVESYLENAPTVKAWSSRVLANGMVASAHYTGGARILGIDPLREAALTDLESTVDSGSYFSESGRNQILLGAALAKKLEVKPGSRVVLTFTDDEHNIISASFKVVGLYDITSSQLEKLQVYVRQSDLLSLLGAAPDQRHEYAALLKDEAQVGSFTALLASEFPTLAIDSWRDLAPELSYADELMTMMLYVIIGIIMLALSFGIINTMLMAVLERRKELGMLMGVGMNKQRIFAMILFETLLLSLCGGPLGILLGYLTIAITGERGLELSMFSDGLESFGISATIYPTVFTSFYYGTTLLVILMAFLSSLYPARMALRLKPVEAIRTI